MTYGATPLRPDHAMSLQRFVAARKHVPRSHPVLVRLYQRMESLDCVLPDVTSSEVGDTTAHLDHLALIVAGLPSIRLEEHRDMLRAIAAELLRRSRA